MLTFNSVKANILISMYSIIKGFNVVEEPISSSSPLPLKPPPPKVVFRCQDLSKTKTWQFIYMFEVKNIRGKAWRVSPQVVISQACRSEPKSPHCNSAGVLLSHCTASFPLDQLRWNSKLALFGKFHHQNMSCFKSNFTKTFTAFVFG